MFRFLRSLGADINALDAYGYPPILNATMLNRVDVVRALIDAGADVQRKGPFGYTALHAAAQGGFLEVVQELIRRGANVNCKNDDKDIPLILGKNFSSRKIIVNFDLFVFSSCSWKSC